MRRSISHSTSDSPSRRHCQGRGQLSQWSNSYHRTGGTPQTRKYLNIEPFLPRPSQGLQSKETSINFVVSSLSASLTATVPDSRHLNISLFVSELNQTAPVEWSKFYQKCFLDDWLTGQTNLHRPRTQRLQDLNTGMEIIILINNSTGGPGGRETHLESSLSITPNSFWWMALKSGNFTFQNDVYISTWYCIFQWVIVSKIPHVNLYLRKCLKYWKDSTVMCLF